MLTDDFVVSCDIFLLSVRGIEATDGCRDEGKGGLDEVLEGQNLSVSGLYLPVNTARNKRELEFLGPISYVFSLIALLVSTAIRAARSSCECLL